MHRLALTALLIAALAGTAEAQFWRRAVQGPVAPPPAGLPPAEAEIWPFPPPDPKSWWDDVRPMPPEAAAPLDGRRLARGERPIAFDNAIAPSTYRLWGLTPLQWQLLRGEEMILEVWIRPTRSVRQSVVRIAVRRDGKTFVQGRAGLACCEAGIARRMGFDAELPSGSAEGFLALRAHPMWSAPRDVRLIETAGVADAVCLEGTAYDLTLVVPGRARALHRACDGAAVGQVADALEPALRAALGHDGRFDVIFPGGADFADDRAAYQALVQAGGRLKADPEARPQPPGFEPSPEVESAPPTPPAPRSSPGPSRQ